MMSWVEKLPAPLEACLISKLYTLLRLLKAPVEESFAIRASVARIKMRSLVLRIPEYFEPLTHLLKCRKYNPREAAGRH